MLNLDDKTKNGNINTKQSANALAFNEVFKNL